MNWYKKYKKANLTIEQIAQLVRDSNVRGYDDEVLKALCLPASRELRDELIKNGYSAMVVQGTFELDDPNPGEIEDFGYADAFEHGEEVYDVLHYWVEVNGLVIDITASQFNDELDEGNDMPPIVIDSYNNLSRYTPVHRGWE